ncbi:MAG: hypothetical protein QW197_02555 [Candidatus Aenigmatarchaeota archaeon]
MEAKEIKEKLSLISELLKPKEEKKTIQQKTRKEKNKEIILNLLREKKIVTLEDVAKSLNISIQRASEYLNELFKEQKVTFFRQNRKKYFKLIE